MNHRALWRPKRREAEQCASCPFLDGNNKEFSAVVNAIKTAAGMELKEGQDVAGARRSVRLEVLGRNGQGDFICHATAYGPGMKLRDPSEFRQCPGATAAWKNGGTKKRGKIP